MNNLTDLFDGSRSSTDKDAEDQADWATTRFGLLGHGVYYIVLALLVGRLAVGGGADANTQGALAAVARQPFGQILLVPLILGFALYAGHHALGAWREDDVLPRVTSAVRALVWAGLTVLSARTLMQGVSGGESGDGGSSSATRTVLELPGGTWIVGAVGLVILGVAVLQGYRAQSSGLASELEDLNVDQVRAAKVLGRVGYAGRAVAYAVMGGFILRAAWTHDPEKAGGMDRSLSQLRDAPYGLPMLLAVAACFLAFGVFRLVEARYRGTD